MRSGSPGWKSRQTGAGRVSVMRSIALATSCVLWLVAFAGTAAGQTTVEYGAAAARAAATVGAIKGAGGVFNGIDKALKSISGPATPKTGTSAPAKPRTAE